MTLWDRTGSVTYQVFDIVSTFDPATGALGITSRTPHPNSPQVLHMQGADTAGSYFNHIYTVPGVPPNPRNSLWVQEHVTDDDVLWIGELGDHKQKHHPPLPYLRLRGPIKLDGASEVWRYANDGECFQHVPAFPWSHFLLTQYLGPNPTWGPWTDPIWQALQERTENAPDVVYQYVTAPVPEVGNSRRLVNFFYGFEPLDGSGQWLGHEYYAVDFT
jgi:hypothetical protein